MLVLRDIRRSFPGVKALSGVDFDLKAGEVHALMGENGAGKSTLMRILGGVIPPEQGSITLRGEPYRPRGPRDAQRAGIGFIHQELNLIPELSVAENLLLGRLPSSAGVVSRVRLREEALSALRAVGEEFSLERPARSLNVGQQQMVEIARALHARAEILIMDEPTAALSDREAQHLFAAIERLRAQGTAIIYISHRMEEVYRLSDRLTVLRDGVSVGTWERGAITPDEVVRSMVGRELSSYEVGVRSAGEVVLEFSSPEVELEVRAGEIVGLAGLVGAGRTELARVVAGADAGPARVRFGGSLTRLREPLDAIRQGVGFVPEDRKGQGLVLGMSVEDNLGLASLGALARLAVLDRKACLELAQRFIAQLRIRTAGPGQVVKTLSGGNQQKVVIGKWLARDCKLLILDEPTRGVDVGAKAEIYKVIEDLVAAGTAVLLISSDLPELLRLSDRVLVMAGGRLTASFTRAEATPEKVLASALG